MSVDTVQPRILLISQWPNVKNGEYELIEKIKQTGYKIAVVDYLGFDVDTGECLNQACLTDEFDFAISFHYDTPKLLNIPTYLWVANPIEFMHLRGDYRTTLIHNLRAYDDYLYNGSDTLKLHIRNVIGSSWQESGLEMFPACSRKSLLSPQVEGAEVAPEAKKIFYCGVNWERGIDRAGRAQGLLDILQDKQIADFYGPNKLEGMSPWAEFSSYKGEIPFDGVTMSRVMRDYGAVLAVSSPAHIKSRTSSSRVFEGFAAGVPVISDENAHVREHFGDLVYYFSGNTEEERAESIQEALQRINNDPGEARQRVKQAQEIMAEKYCFEACFEQIIKSQTTSVSGKAAPKRVNRIDVFVFHHDPDPLSPGAETSLVNLSYVLHAAEHFMREGRGDVRIICCLDKVPTQGAQGAPLMECYHPSELTNTAWDKLRLGDKISLLAKRADADLVAFLTQFDFPHHDYFTKAAGWYEEREERLQNGLYIAGFYVNDLKSKAPAATAAVLRNNTTDAMYRWSQNSLAEHQLATLMFSREALRLVDHDQLSRFDAVLPVAIVALAISKNFQVERSRHLLLRICLGYFHRHYEAFSRAARKGFWTPHYELVSNYNHELNALYDLLHESPQGVQIADHVSGYSLPSTVQVDPAVHAVNQFINRLRPIYRVAKKLKIPL